MDQIGNITVPQVIPSGVFPFVADYGGFGRAREPKFAVHPFLTANGKIEQRFLLGNGANRYMFRRNKLSETDRNQLRVHWENNSGPFGAFIYNVPSDDGRSSTPTTVAYAAPNLDWTFLTNAISSIGVEFIEIPDPASAPNLPLNDTQTRFPSSAFSAALQSQYHVMIPLIRIIPKKTSYPQMFVSDRRCTIGGQLYQARLLKWDGISQSMISGADPTSGSDDALFTFGNADRVMTALMNDVNLFRSRVEFSAYHVGTGIKLDIWAGEVIRVGPSNAGPEFPLQCSDGFYELRLPFPPNTISRTCPKLYNDGLRCPWALVSGTTRHSLTVIMSNNQSKTYTFTPDPSSCDRGFDTPNGCMAHLMEPYFGGIAAVPQPVRTKDNSTGVFGFGRSPLTSTSLISDSVFDKVRPRIYTDVEMPVNCLLIEGRDEGDFYTALGIVGDGPLTQWGVGDTTLNTGNMLDGQFYHGYPRNNFGLRRGAGHDPVQNGDPDGDSDKFSLGEGGSGPQRYNPQKAAGTAFMEIRRTDAKGLQLSTLDQHQMQAVIAQGLKGWIWSATGHRQELLLTNPVWVALDAIFAARGYRFLPDLTLAEGSFDANAAIATASTNDLTVPLMFGTGTQKQFKFIGIIQERKTLTDWLKEILNPCLGYYYFSFGKVVIGQRINASVKHAFSIGNTIMNSVQVEPFTPAFNEITANFGDQAWGFVGNTVNLKEYSYAAFQGNSVAPLFTPAEINYVGAANQDQVARLVTTRLREELGGVNQAQWDAARNVKLRTTILSLEAAPGDVCSLTHDDCPTYPPAIGTAEPDISVPNFVKWRLKGWKLNPDWSIDMMGTGVHADMYNLDAGPKPADVAAVALPTEPEFAPADISFDSRVNADGNLYLYNFNCATNSLTVHQGTFQIYYVPEADRGQTFLPATMLAADASGQYAGAAPVLGDLIIIESEIMNVSSVTPTDANSGTFTVERGHLGTIAADHLSVARAISSATSASDLVIPSGLDILPGYNLALDPSGEQRPIASYDPVTGAVTSLLPFSAPPSGNFFADHRIYPVAIATEVVPFAPRFFKSGDRALYEHPVNLPSAGVVAVSCVLENTLGLQSVPAINLFSESPAHRLRTLGAGKTEMIHDNLPSGVAPDVFQPLTFAVAESIGGIHAERSTDGGAGKPIDAPRGLTQIGQGNPASGGSITIAGVINKFGHIQVIVGEKPTSNIFTGRSSRDTFTVEAPTFQVTTEATASAVAASLATWLNDSPEFAVFVQASASGAMVLLRDLIGTGGKVIANTWGGVTATATGMVNQLGVFTGRRYAVSFRDVADGLESELSPASVSTGPSGAALRIEIKDIPSSVDSRVDTVRIWALPDGLDAPGVTTRILRGVPHRIREGYRLIGTVSNGTQHFSDTMPESTLTSAAAFPGAVQPTGPGAQTITLQQGGRDWLQLRIPANAAWSNVVDGLAVDGIQAGAVITADSTNAYGSSQLRVIFQ
jgi:hypothetical protein